MSTIPHIPVLYTETIDAFKDIKNGYVIDCTLGYGGHTQGILDSNEHIIMIGNDQDDEALDFSKNRLESYKNRVIFNKGNFQNVVNTFSEKNITGILADIGVSSLQLDKESRGFGFKSEVLDMRMDQSNPFSANDVVNTYSQNQLETIIKEYGEFKEYKKAASLIIKNRPFNSAKELSTMFENNFKRGKFHPATLPFQAIRIEVNKELEVLKQLFDSIEKANLKNTTVAIISFHSLEDRIVKNYFKKWSTKCICPTHFMKCECGGDNQLGRVLTRKPIIPSNEEIKTNPRSRSSKLRIFKFD